MKSRHWRAPLDLSRWMVPRGEVHVIPDRCKGCGLCIEYCPRDVLDWSDEFNSRGVHYPVVRPDRAEACINCGFCESICPDFAIFNVRKGLYPPDSVEGGDDSCTT